MTANGNNEKKDYELVPPEGGWGYAVCVGLTVCFICGTAHIPSLGFIFQDFLADLGEGTGALATVQSVFSFMTAIAGFASGIAMKKISLRTTGLIGSAIFCMGFFLGIFVQTTWHFIITNGVLQGFGIGVMIPVLYTTYNTYFTIKKVLYLSLCKAGIGLIIMLYPLILKYTMEHFGFRGTLAILFAVSLNTIPGAMVMHPVRWHMKERPKIPKVQADHYVVTNVIPPTPAVDNNDIKHYFTGKEISNGCADQYCNKDIERTRSHEQLRPLISTSEEDPLKANELLSPELLERSTSTPVVSLGRRRKSSTLQITIPDRAEEDMNMQRVIRAVSMSSLGNFGVDSAPQLNKSGKWQTVAMFLDLNLFKDSIYANIAVGLSFSFFADLMFFALEPMLLHHYNFNATQTTNIISVGGATDMAGKLLLAIVGQFYSKIDSRKVYFTGSILAAAMRTVFLQYDDYVPVLFLTAVLGLLRSMLHIMLPLVIAAHVPIERYPAAYGLTILIFGFINLIVGPAIGIVRDVTGSYPLAFHLLSVCNMLCVVPWSVEVIIRYTRRKTSK